MGSPVTWRMQFSHLASDTSHGTGVPSPRADVPWLEQAGRVRVESGRAQPVRYRVPGEVGLDEPHMGRVEAEPLEPGSRCPDERHMPCPVTW